MKTSIQRLLLKAVSSSLCGGLLIASASAAQGASPPVPPSPGSLTLSQAVDLALAANPELRAAGARIDAASGRAYQAGVWSNPGLEIGVEEWPVSGGRSFSEAKQTIGIAQTLPWPGKKSLEKRAGNSVVKLSEQELALRRTEIVRDVKAGFFRVLASERLAEVARQLLEVAESSAATARKRVDAGATPYQEQLRAEVQLEQARTALTTYDRNLAGARLALAALLGQPGMKDAKLLGSLAEEPDPNLMEPVTAERIAHHPSAAAAQANLERTRLEERRSRLEPYPDVKVGVAGGTLGETDESIVELSFSLPLPLIDRGKGKRQESRANVSVAEAELQSLQQQLGREWAIALKRYETAAKQVGGYRERILPKASEALRLVQTGFEQGKFSFIDLLDTQRTTAEARLAYQQTLLELNIAQAELEAIIQPQTATSSTLK